MYDFGNKVAFVTGAARGIGREVALRLAREGAALALADVLEEEARATAAEAAKQGVRALAMAVDVRDRAAVRAAVGRTLEALGPIDFLVNVAGVGICNPFLDVPEDDWDRTIDINLKGTFLTCQEIGRRMAERRQGRIVNIASISGKTGSEILVPYSSSKGGVILLTQSVAKALAPFGVNANAVCPGLVWTPMWRETATWLSKNHPAFAGQNLAPEAVYEQMVKTMTPLGKPTTTADIAAAVAFLLSDEAALITGQAINVDGGIEMH